MTTKDAELLYAWLIRRFGDPTKRKPLPISEKRPRR
jgi:hypothetical protein